MWMAGILTLERREEGAEWMSVCLMPCFSKRVASGSRDGFLGRIPESTEGLRELAALDGCDSGGGGTSLMVCVLMH